MDSQPSDRYFFVQSSDSPSSKTQPAKPFSSEPPPAPPVNTPYHEHPHYFDRFAFRAVWGFVLVASLAVGVGIGMRLGNTGESQESAANIPAETVRPQHHNTAPDRIDHFDKNGALTSVDQESESEADAHSIKEASIQSMLESELGLDLQDVKPRPMAKPQPNKQSAKVDVAVTTKPERILTPTKLENAKSGSIEQGVKDKAGPEQPAKSVLVSHKTNKPIVSEKKRQPKPPAISTSAFYGDVFGVAKISIDYGDNEEAPVVHPDEDLVLVNPTKRTSYAVFVPEFADEEAGNYRLTRLNSYVLFQGRMPVDVKIYHPKGEMLFHDDLKVGNDRMEHWQMLNEWWSNYVEQGKGQNDNFKWVHRKTTEMLGRRLSLKLPSTWEKETKSKAISKVEHEFERVLSTLMGIDSVLIAMGEESSAKKGVDTATADQPLPNPINVRSVVTGSSYQSISVEAISKQVPEECFYVRCNTLKNYEWLRSFLTRWNGSLSEIVKISSSDANLRQKVEHQLALDLATCQQMGLEKFISDFALIGCDLNFADGAAVGVIFEANNSNSVQQILRRLRIQALKKQSDVTESHFTINGRAVSFLHSPGNNVRSYLVNAGKYQLITNSEYIARRFTEANQGQRSLGRLNEFLIARQKVPASQANVVQIYLSDPFFRVLVSPKYRIEAKRRKRASEELKHLALAVAIAKAEKLESLSVEELKRSRYLPASFNQRPDGSTAGLTASKPIDSLRGARGTLKPIADTFVTQATVTELLNYRNFASKYQRQWRRMDPVVANLSVKPSSVPNTENVELDMLVVPYARERYERFNRYLLPSSQEISSQNEDLLSLTTSLRGPRGRMLARMGIVDDLITYQVRNGKVVTTGDHKGKSLADANLYAMVNSGGIEGLKTVGNFVKSLQGNTTLNLSTRSTPRRRSPKRRVSSGGSPLGLVVSVISGSIAFDMIDMIGSVGKISGIETSGQWTAMAARKSVRKQIVNAAEVTSAKQQSQIRFQMKDVQRSKALDYVNAYTYMESRRVSASNSSLLNYMSQQLPLSPSDAPNAIHDILGVKLICPLGGSYAIRRNENYQYWNSSVAGDESLYEIWAVPEDYSFPFLKWLRGVELDFNLSRNTLTSKVRLVTQKN